MVSSPFPLTYGSFEPFDRRTSQNSTISRARTQVLRLIPAVVAVVVSKV